MHASPPPSPVTPIPPLELIGGQSFAQQLSISGGRGSDTPPPPRTPHPLKENSVGGPMHWHLVESSAA